MLRRLALLVVAALGIAATPVHAAPDGSRVDGIPCEAAEGTVFHIHAHLAIFDHGRAARVPDNVGRPSSAPCLYWLHTHTDDGIIHIESPTFRSFTLGQFFDVWGEPLSKSVAAGARASSGAMHIWVNRRPYPGDPRKIELVTHADVTIEAGPPYHVPTPFTAWNGQ